MLHNQLSLNQINYVIFHLKQHVDFDHRFFYFCLSSEISNHKIQQKIVFPLSNNPADCSQFFQFGKQTLPNLFPLSCETDLFYWENKNLIFRHDFLKSAFLILSGYQETLNDERDWIGRFQYKNSLQAKLGFTTLPVVNYYFEIIISGIEAFCKHHSLPFARKRLFDNFGFFLSHDVDRIAFYHPREVAFKMKQLLGLSPRYYSWGVTLQLFIKGLFFQVNPFNKKDPWWNFHDMIQLEKELGIRSSFYFLQKEHKNMDSRYRFNDKKIRQLITELQKNGFEVGLHGSILSAESQESLIHQAKALNNVTDTKTIGIRQHFLRFFYPATFYNQLAAGLQYDSSLGFAEHEGFRNGYCYPFKPFDHEKNQMIDIWELPLMLMEVSVLNYQKGSLADIDKATEQLIHEVQKFGGFFSLLWHNCRLDEYQFPGVNKCYRYLLKKIMLKKAEAVTGNNILQKLESKSS
jgi:hypothetical protein